MLVRGMRYMFKIRCPIQLVPNDKQSRPHTQKMSHDRRIAIINRTPPDPLWLTRPGRSECEYQLLCLAFHTSGKRTSRLDINTIAICLSNSQDTWFISDLFFRVAYIHYFVAAAVLERQVSNSSRVARSTPSRAALSFNRFDIVPHHSCYCLSSLVSISSSRATSSR
jgi:hypothetical protein